MSTSLLVSTRKGLFLARRNAAGFKLAKPSFFGAAVSLSMQDPRDGALYAALEHGHFGPKLHRSDDRGKSWREIAVPAYPKPKKSDVVTDGMGRKVPWSTTTIWALEIDPATPGGLWCGTVPGGLFHSKDRGRSWRLMRGLWDQKVRAKWNGGGKDGPGLHSVCVDPRDPNLLTVGVSSGGIWQSFDHGETWVQAGHGLRAEHVPKGQEYDPVQQDPHRVVQCPSAPDRVWCQHHNGIFRSDDGGTTFKEIKKVTPSAFGFAVAVHPRDPDVAWFVPGVKDECRVPGDGRFVVTQTRDGGKTFRSLANGLPKPAYDLVYRHALDVADDGKTLAVGSTTGGLWVSANGGTKWQCLSAHLPPIYALRFTK
ncbi:MAG: exo-alpha-sialidase [Planctomycetota bacterium]